MRFELSERIETGKSAEIVLDKAFEQFRKVSVSAKQDGDSTFVAKGIEATFGSINRSDSAHVTARPVEDGWLLVADITYRPSVMFWVFIALSFLVYVSWIFSLVFYFIQRNTVRQAAQGCLQRVSNELRSPTGAALRAGQKTSPMEDLAKLAELKERGHITDEEFAAHKLRLLRAA